MTLSLALAGPLHAVCGLDTAFGGAGLRTYSSPSGGTEAIGRDLLVLSDGRVLVAGWGTTVGGDRDAAWWAMDSSGNLSASAAYNGLAGSGQEEEYNAAAQAPGGGPVYLAGSAIDSFGNTCGVLTRLNFPALTLDTAFGAAWGAAGSVSLPSGVAATSVVTDIGWVFTLHGNKIFSWTISGPSAGTTNPLGFQFDPSGTGHDMRLDHGHRLVISGAVPGGVALWRLLGNGALDGSFNGSGKTSVAVATVSDLSSVTVEADDSLLATGFAYEPVSFKSRWIAYRVGADGIGKAGFGSSGLAQGTDQTNLASLESADGALVNADGTLLLTGKTPSGFLELAAFWRLLGGGGLDSSSGSAQQSVAGQPGILSRPREAGAYAYATGYYGSGMALWRLAACGSGPGSVNVPAGTLADRPTAFPSPAKDHVTFAFQLAQVCDVRLEVYDERGVRLSSESRPFSAGPANWRLDTSAYAPGVYLYRLKPSAGTALQVSKFVVRP